MLRASLSQRKVIVRRLRPRTERLLRSTFYRSRQITLASQTLAARVALSPKPSLGTLLSANPAPVWVFHFCNGALAIYKAKDAKYRGHQPQFVTPYWGYICAVSTEIARQTVLNALAERAKAYPITISLFPRV